MRAVSREACIAKANKATVHFARGGYRKGRVPSSADELVCTGTHTRCTLSQRIHQYPEPYSMPPFRFDELTSALAAYKELLLRVPEADARLVL